MLAQTEPLSELHRMLVKIGRERHANRINRVINDPSVLPFVRGNGTVPLDLTAGIANPGNVLLMGQHGGIFFHVHQQGLYEAHVAVLPEGRGAWAKAMVEAAIHWLFTRTDAIEVFGVCPIKNRPVRALARSVGWRRQFASSGDEPPADIYSRTIHDWWLDAPGLVERGRWAREQIENEIGRKRDPVGDRAMGLFYEMALGGNAFKGVAFFNAWAAKARWAQLQLNSLQPVGVTDSSMTMIIRDNGTFFTLKAPVLH